MKIGDVVTRKSYNDDIDFIIESICGDHAVLSGLDYRLLADADMSDLKISSAADINKHTCSLVCDQTEDSMVSAANKCMISDFFRWHNDRNKTIFENIISGNTGSKSANEFKSNCLTKVLHIDGNEKYLKECLRLYKKLNVQVIGVSIKEDKQPISILGLLTKYRPNILVITGHDSICKDKSAFKDMGAYLNSKYFVESVKIARSYNSNYDELVIIAGGCNSCYEALIEAGANFASSPNRVLISITEPVNIACKLATTSIRKILSMEDIAPEVASGLEGFGGLETRGQCRVIKPGL